MKRWKTGVKFRRRGRKLLTMAVIAAVAVTAAPAMPGNTGGFRASADTKKSAAFEQGASEQGTSERTAARADHDNTVRIGGRFHAGGFRGIPEGKAIETATKKETKKVEGVRLIRPLTENGRLTRETAGSGTGRSIRTKNSILDDLKNLIGSAADRTASKQTTETESAAAVSAPDNGTSKYYYSKLTAKEKILYNAILTCAADPYKLQRVVFNTNSSSKQSGFTEDQVEFVYYGLCYDHPELFWLWMADSPVKQGVEEVNNADGSSTKITNTGKGKYNWYVWIDYNSTYDSGMHRDAYDQTGYYFTKSRLQKMAQQLDRAANNFLSDINLNQPKAVVALEIHDKYLKTVSYNSSAAQADASFYHRAHTAYGALVDHAAVCDGYSLGLKYLLSRAGIPSVMVPGIVGTGSDRSNYGGHAWNLVQLGSKWYEVDSTWDDDGAAGHEHTYFNLTTKNMTTMKDPVIRKTVHHYRDENIMNPNNGYWFGTGVRKALPTAASSHFQYSYVSQHGKTLPDNTDPLGRTVSFGTSVNGAFRSFGTSKDEARWTVRVLTGSGTGLKRNGTLWSAAVTVPSDSALTVQKDFTTASQAFTLSRSGRDSGSRQVSARVTYDNGTTGIVQDTLGIRTEAALRPASFTYSGTPKSPALLLTSYGDALAAAEYSAVFAGKNSPEDPAGSPDTAGSAIGRYAVRVQFSGFLQQQKPTVLYYSILPAAPSLRTLKSLTPAAKKKVKNRKAVKGPQSMKVSWKTLKSASGASGYEIQYSTTKKFSAGRTTTKTVRKLSTGELTLRKLKSGVRYYVRIRSFATGPVFDVAEGSSSASPENPLMTIRLRTAWFRTMTRTA